MQGMYSMRSPAVKRLMKEAQELSEPTEQYACQPLEDNLFEWHFTIRGPADSEFGEGLYHGRIILPPEYPMKPPSIILLTHNGRFEVNKKICLSISGHHPESWQPSWSLRTALLAIIGFMPTHGAGALGSLDYTPDERKKLAKRSQEFVCPTCGPINNVLKEVTEESEKTTEEARELAAQISFKDEKEKNAALRSAPPEAPLSPPEQADSGPPAPTGNAEQPQQQQGPPVFPPSQFGQFPFQMPALPPFPLRPQEQQGSASSVPQVPRFPLPFIGPMMPPYPPFMTQGFPVPPGIPGVGVPPWQMAATPPQAATLSASSPANTGNTSDASLGTSTSVQPNPSREANSASDSSANTTAPESPEVTTPTVESQSERNDISQTGTSSVRQRHVAMPPETEAPPPQPASPHRVFQSAQTHTRHTQSESPAFLVFATVIIAIISFLVLRRLYMMNYFGFTNLR